MLGILLWLMDYILYTDKAVMFHTFMYHLFFSLFYMQIKEHIFEIAKRLNMPINVRSTSVLVYNALEAAKNGREGAFVGQILSDEESYAILCVFMGAKFEDIHGNLEETFSKHGISLDRAVEVEAAAMEQLGFSFAFPSPYMQLAAFQMIQGKDSETFWERECVLLERLLTADGSYSSLEYAAAATGANTELLNLYNINIDNVKILKNKLISLV